MLNKPTCKKNQGDEQVFLFDPDVKLKTQRYSMLTYLFCLNLSSYNIGSNKPFHCCHVNKFVYLLNTHAKHFNNKQFPFVTFQKDVIGSMQTKEYQFQTWDVNILAVLLAECRNSATNSGNYAHCSGQHAPCKVNGATSTNKGNVDNDEVQYFIQI